MDAGPLLPQALHCPRVLVTSPAAARFAGAQIALVRQPGQRWFALGAGTAAVLHRAGIDPVLTPELGVDSESLLAHPQLQDVRGEHIGLITAPGGRDLLTSQLQARGAVLSIAEVYRRQAQPVTRSRLRALAALPAHSALLMTSSEAFSLLWQALDAAARQRLLRRPCLVASARMEGQARSLGFPILLRAPDQRPASLLATLADHAAGRGFG